MRGMSRQPSLGRRAVVAGASLALAMGGGMAPQQATAPNSAPTSMPSPHNQVTRTVPNPNAPAPQTVQVAQTAVLEERRRDEDSGVGTEPGKKKRRGKQTRAEMTAFSTGSRVSKTIAGLSPKDEAQEDEAQNTEDAEAAAEWFYEPLDLVDYIAMQVLEIAVNAGLRRKNGSDKRRIEAIIKGEIRHHREFGESDLKALALDVDVEANHEVGRQSLAEIRNQVLAELKKVKGYELSGRRQNRDNGQDALNDKGPTYDEATYATYAEEKERHHDPIAAAEAVTNELFGHYAEQVEEEDRLDYHHEQVSDDGPSVSA